MSATRAWSTKWRTTRTKGISLFIKESFINKPELAFPLVGFPLLLVALGVRYSLRVKDVDEFRKYKSEYTIVRYEDLKDPDRPYFN